VISIIDIHTWELLDLRVHDGWDVDSAWTAQVFDAVVRRMKRKPTAVVHDHGPHFLGTFSRQLRVLEVGEETTPTGLPSMNCYAERAIGSIRRELVRHIRVADAKELQFFLDEYRQYANTKRPHQGLCGRTPEEASARLSEADVIDIAVVRARRLVRRPYAHGLLQGYSLVEDDSAREAA
jgi:transposase InsO family protein